MTHNQHSDVAERKLRQMNENAARQIEESFDFERRLVINPIEAALKRRDKFEILCNTYPILRWIRNFFAPVEPQLVVEEEVQNARQMLREFHAEEAEWETVKTQGGTFCGFTFSRPAPNPQKKPDAPGPA